MPFPWSLPEKPAVSLPAKPLVSLPEKPQVKRKRNPHNVPKDQMVEVVID